MTRFLHEPPERKKHMLGHAIDIAGSVFAGLSIAAAILILAFAS